MNKGFYTALGTPFDSQGRFLATSFDRQVQDQVAAGASGLLILGSMGLGPNVARCQVRSIVKTGIHAAAGRCAVLAGVSDNGIANVLDRIEQIRDLKLDGVVSTTPFYQTCSQEELFQFFFHIAEQSVHPLYLYDLPTVTKTPILAETVLRLYQATDRIRGIKTGNLFLARILQNALDPERFTVLYSGLDAFDVAWESGYQRQLDGMFAALPDLTQRLYGALNRGERTLARQALDQILSLRDIFIKLGVMRAFTSAMNLLGYEGNFSADYSPLPDESITEAVRVKLTELGSLPRA